MASSSVFREKMGTATRWRKKGCYAQKLIINIQKYRVDEAALKAER